MTLDPVLLQLIGQMPTVAEQIDFAQTRLDMDNMVPVFNGPDGPIEVASVEDAVIPGLGGSVPLRIFRPLTPATGTLHMIHGGGWSFGSVSFIEPLARRLARDLSMVVVANGYRLAPEHPFPAGLEDCLAAAQWTLEHRAHLGGAANPSVIAGESAGGNLAAASAIALANGRGVQFDAQLLFYPATDLRDSRTDYASFRANADPTLRTEYFPQLGESYCGSHDRADPRISPITAESLDSLPPAVVVVLTVDPLRDEGVAYADRLRDAGVDVELIEFGNLNHGFPNLSALVPAAADATTHVCHRLQAQLARTH